MVQLPKKKSVQIRFDTHMNRSRFFASVEEAVYEELLGDFERLFSKQRNGHDKRIFSVNDYNGKNSIKVEAIIICDTSSFRKTPYKILFNPLVSFVPPLAPVELADFSDSGFDNAFMQALSDLYNEILEFYTRNYGGVG